MNHVQLHAIGPDGPWRLALPPSALTNIHALFDDLPVGVYTSLRTYRHNQFFHLSDHLDRLEQSMALLGWDYDLDRSRLRKALQQVCDAYPEPDARVRIDILAEPIFLSGHKCRELIGLFPFKPIPDQLYRSGVRVATVRQLHRANPRAKQAQFAQERRPYLNDEPGVYERLLLDPAGFILEGTSSNFYAVKDGVLWTAGEGVLEGVTRKIVLKVAEESGIPIRLQPVHVTEIRRLDECALSSSSRAILPIVEIDGQVVGNGRPGPLTHQLLLAYNDYLEGALAPAFPEPANPEI